MPLVDGDKGGVDLASFLLRVCCCLLFIVHFSAHQSVSGISCSCVSVFPCVRLAGVGVHCVLSLRPKC